MNPLLPLILAAAAWTPEETLRPAGQDAVLTVERNAASEDSPRLTVAAGRINSVFRFVPEGGVQPLGEVFPKGTPGENALESDYLYAPPELARGDGEWTVLAFGRAFASDPGPMLVVGLAHGWTPAPLLKLDTFVLTRVQDLDGDGRAEIIGRPSLSQSFDECRLTYDPYLVYRQAERMGPFVLDEGMSAAYARRVGYPWAGPRPREDVAVDMCAHVNIIVPAPK